MQRLLKLTYNNSIIDFLNMDKVKPKPRFTEDALHRMTSVGLNPLARLIATTLAVTPSPTYQKVSDQLARSGFIIHRDEIGGFVSGLRGKRETRCTNNFRLLGERYTAANILNQLEQGEVPVNQKASYLGQVFDALERYQPRDIGYSEGVVYRSSFGSIHAAAQELNIHPEFITEIGRYARFELGRLAKKDPDNSSIQKYLEVVRQVAKNKSEKRLGKIRSDHERLLSIATQLKGIKTYADLEAIGKIPNEWLSEMFIGAIPILRPLLTDPNHFEETDRELLTALSHGSQTTEEIAKAMGLSHGATKLLKNLLIHGQPTGFVKNIFI